MTSRARPFVFLTVVTAIVWLSSGAGAASRFPSTYSTAVLLGRDDRLPAATAAARAAARRGCVSGAYTWAHILLIHRDGGFGWFDFECARWRAPATTDSVMEASKFEGLAVSSSLSTESAGRLRVEMTHARVARLFGGGGTLVIDARLPGEQPGDRPRRRVHFKSYVWVSSDRQWGVETLFVNDRLVYTCSYTTVCEG